MEPKFFRVEGRDGEKHYLAARGWDSVLSLIKPFGDHFREKTLAMVLESDVREAPFYECFLASGRRLGSDGLYSLGVL